MMTDSTGAADLLPRLTGFFASRQIPAYLVGGWVRDALLRLPPGLDIDLAIAADPYDTGRELARRLDADFVPLGKPPAIDRPVARIVLPAPCGRDCRTIDLSALSGNLEDDLARRDFTVNALAAPLDQWDADAPGDSVIDPWNGRRDMASRVIRTVRPDVFQKDPGRLLRAVRLAGRLRFRIAPETSAAILESAPRVNRVSGERLRDELMAVLSLDGARGYLEVMDRLDLLCRVIPELAEAKGVAQPRQHYWDVWGHLLHSVEYAESVTRGHQNSPVYSLSPWTAETEAYFDQRLAGGHTRRTYLKLAALFHDIAKPRTKTTEDSGRIRFFGHPEMGRDMTRLRLAQLRLPVRGIEAVAAMVNGHMRPATMWQGLTQPTPRAAYRFFRDMKGVAVDTLYLCLADYLAAKGPSFPLNSGASMLKWLRICWNLGPGRKSPRGKNG